MGNVSPSSVTKYLKNISNPSQDTLALWATALNIDLNWLLLGEGNTYRSLTPAAKDAEIAALNQELLALHRKYAAAMENLRKYEVREEFAAYEGAASPAVQEEPAPYTSEKRKKAALPAPGATNAAPSGRR